ncbi:MAG TPA: N-acetylmuramoyl-L-alanine amidase [Saprospiraceae bacterium]|nr:N-acetylmuramoyl-L-alanine amidase [Saprospiraceae bacterium]
MRFTEVNTLEATIAAAGLPHLLKEPFEIPVSGDIGLNLTGMLCHRRDRLATYYYQERIRKERIVIHFTAGHLRGDLVTLMGKVHVSVPYVIARDGTIYQLFDPAFWSYHLGPDALGGNKNQSSRTIGIELSNYGPLMRNGTQLETIYSTPSRRDVYCSLNDRDQYLNLPEPFRDQSYYASFTGEQYDSLILVLRHLTHQFDIPGEFLELPGRYQATNAVLSHKGIVSHVNYRTSGKWDIGPAFDWDYVISGTQASTFRPLTPLEHSINRKQREIAAEEKVLEQQLLKIQLLKEELATLQHAFSNPAPRDLFVREGIFSQEEANAIFQSDVPVPGDSGEEMVEPGYNPLYISDTSRNMEKLKIHESELRALVQSEITPPEELDKYFTTNFEDPFSGYLELRENVEIIPDASGVAAEKGAVMNLVVAIANNWARGNRNKKYRNRLKAEPDAVRILSEGDSWFQHPHPKVLDIIDQLSNHYPIYCIGAAGDTVRNMFYEGEFLQAIRDEKPRIFLLSGGGNDILGSQFRNFLSDRLDQVQDGTTAARFLKDNFKRELDSIGNIYRTVFEKLKDKPIEIIVHGYDYVIPWTATDKGWLGRYMIEKGINDQTDRAAIIREMLDQFNAKLLSVTKEYPRVHYIDLRNTVRTDQWYDEIHPSSAGYQDIALKYHALIEKLLAH